MADVSPDLAPGADRGLRLAAGGLALGLAAVAFLLRGTINPRLQAVFGIVCFIAIVAAFSRNLRAVNWRTVGWGMALDKLAGILEQISDRRVTP